jgi:hypothetical protein
MQKRASKMKRELTPLLPAFQALILPFLVANMDKEVKS